VTTLLALEGTFGCPSRSGLEFRQQHAILLAIGAAGPRNSQHMRRRYRLNFGHGAS
jgi:hypothetical protein